MLAGLVLLVAGAFGGPAFIRWSGVALLIIGFACYLRIGTVRAEPTDLRLPVDGRWWPINSPGTKVPSHGLHGWGQTYAMDILHVPEGKYAPKFGWAPEFKPAREFVSFSQPIRAPAAGTVVAAFDRRRDHRARTSWPALIYFFLEGGLRELTGPRGILGNHVVLDLGDGRYVAMAHLQQGSLTVQRGSRVEIGQQIARCGNSGNSTEPHVHLQVMDHPRLALAAGLPFRLVDAVGDDGSPADVPADGDAVRNRDEPPDAAGESATGDTL